MIHNSFFMHPTSPLSRSYLSWLYKLANLINLVLKIYLNLKGKLLAIDFKILFLDLDLIYFFL